MSIVSEANDGVKHVELFNPVLETLANVRWTVVPWAVVGASTGAIIGGIGGWLEVMTCSVGMVSDVFVVLSNAPFDGWLALTMPVGAFIGTGLGLAAGMAVRLVIMVWSR
jgi:hypothetical protein